ncbi:hypothetical protein P3T37_002194 [Kitasatospora sp. MAA4]|uniref:hypothetical protein n=1 Tax=Kitasatospora sp. MAA4 TaxID=3035093 RepID=UPI0024735D22|nr:hypothetical protein [Kitasatospora sp. MAA4]MDH6132808.1 hypothetical protein [Kitasatospora sp. MAA4]
MRVHRSAHVRNFTVLPNGLLQDRRLSYTARGLLADLLSRPDYWREDGRAMADSSPQGRGAIRKALKELTAAGYYRVVKLRLPDGTIRSEAHVFDTPQRPDLPPGVPRPVSGKSTTGGADIPLVKDRVQEPALPDRAKADDEQVRAAAVTLFRVIKAEPRLRLGEAEAMALAPLVAQWLERGGTPGELTQALLPGLPSAVHSPVGLLRTRLKRKMPPERPAFSSSYDECAKCHDPVPQPGICRPCAGLDVRVIAVGGGAAATLGGAGRARAAMEAARSALGMASAMRVGP